ncbi:glycerophosphodiester phosphodiesterase gde1 [Plasmopara halstedii]|uniref:Glycerophosphodiester phosphodiesterase gde1 n=1 Tax=Plasmopara halstedii TaxID=4781 RepID=A0A0P1AFB6_PLAHL|nr:glycerophosphodiester phosphodiesterase gde1 [Plasmopara halstedii]CEG39184.1 glycerophosphodiester phosphodiesterase gde1 [Plasmopara halstedii]|eukprot:XP_024575553.1 glycerophosphodiester phosphodiesterase gde1 [Plasmopara halstedii]
MPDGRPRVDYDPAEVEFTVRVLGDANERVVYLLGSAMEIGAWDIEKAVPMELKEQQDNESKWNLNVKFASTTSTIEYKYVVKHSKTHELLLWEGLPGNRTLTIASGINVALGAPSTQSSTFTTTSAPVPGPRDAKLGNNGKTNGFQEWRCCRTKKESNPWWEVDLGHNYVISSIHLWNAMTYHEQARHLEGRPPLTSCTSTSFSAPPLWIFVSKEPLGRGEDSFEDAQSKIAAGSSSVRAIQMPCSYDSRVRSLNFVIDAQSVEKTPNEMDCSSSSAATPLPPVEGRYVRLQHVGTSCALQFAELEVFSQDAEVTLDEERQARCATRRHIDDGFFGISKALDADSREYIDSGWLNPDGGLAELQIWTGSFNATRPAIQWLEDRVGSGRVTVVMRHEKQITRSNGTDQNEIKCQSKKQPLLCEWEPLPVETTSAHLLDKDSTDLRQLLTAHQELGGSGLLAYLNNDSMLSPPPEASSKSSWLSRLALAQSPEISSIKALADKTITHKYNKGDDILQYSEQKHAVFYIDSGHVELIGPQSSTGSNRIGVIQRDSIFNELGLMGYWSRQPTLFRAKDDVTCQVLDLDALVEALGETKVAIIRDEYIRRTFKLKDLSEDNKVHYTDDTHVQVFRVKVPVPVVNDHANNIAELTHRWTFEFYNFEKKASSEAYPDDKLLGSAYLLPSQLNSQGEAELTIPIFSSELGIVGQFTLSYLTLIPFVHPKNNIANVWRSYWRERPPLTIGHRGMGRSYYQVNGHRLALTRENTLASLILAGRSGADFVEFDVQLTKDRVPVIYHDFLVHVGLEDKNAGSFGTKSETYEIGIHDMSFRQLTQSFTTPVPHHGSEGKLLQKRVKKHWARLQGDKKISSPRRGPFTSDDSASDDDHLVEFFPRLADLLKHVPVEIGLNIEVKYPDPFFHATMRSLSCFAINGYVDKILQCVFDFAGSRRIFFSCFDPNVCIALRAKQAKYPVLFLTYGTLEPHEVDARITLQFAINFAKMEKLQGIVSNSKAFIDTPELAPLVKKTLGTVLITWGDMNTNHEMVQLQKRYAIDGVISDNVIDLLNQDKKLLAMAQ